MSAWRTGVWQAGVWSAMTWGCGALVIPAARHQAVAEASQRAAALATLARTLQVTTSRPQIDDTARPGTQSNSRAEVPTITRHTEQRAASRSSVTRRTRT